MGFGLNSIFGSHIFPLINKLWAKDLSGENVSFRPGRQEMKVTMTLLAAPANNSLIDEEEGEIKQDKKNPITYRGLLVSVH